MRSLMTIVMRARMTQIRENIPDSTRKWTFGLAKSNNMTKTSHFGHYLQYALLTIQVIGHYIMMISLPAALQVHDHQF